MTRITSTDADPYSTHIDQVLALVEAQLAKTSPAKIHALILVGGFAASEYLFNRVEETFGNRIQTIARPQDADVATLQGAARYGLGLKGGKAAVSSVICPRSYIMSEYQTFQSLRLDNCVADEGLADRVEVKVKFSL